MLIRLTLRMLRRSPWFTAACVGTVALSIAVASTVFAVVDGVLFKPLPYPDPGRLELVSHDIEDPLRREQMRQRTGRAGTLFSAAHLEEWRVAAPDVAISAFVTNFGIGPIPGTGLTQETTWAARVDRMFFDVLGLRPLIGGFRDEHYRHPFQHGELAAHPAIISHRLWDRIRHAGFDRSRDLLRVEDGTLQIVGVLPRDFVFPAAFARTTPDVLLPLEVTADQRGLLGVARIPARGSAQAVRERLRRIVLEPVTDALGRSERSVFGLTFTAVLAVVLLASLNVATLLAARGRDRAGELAVRVALGAPRSRLLQLVLAEALAIAVAGGALGALAAKPLLEIALTLLPSGYLLLKPPAIDVRVVTFGLLTAIGTLLVFAMWPAVRASRGSAYAGLRQAHGWTRSSQAWRSVAITAQSAIGILVVIAGTLLVAGFASLWQEDVGIERRGTALVDVTAGAVADPERQRAMLQQAYGIAARVPGVERISVLIGPFLRNAIAGSLFLPPSGSTEVIVQDIPVSQGFFDTSGIRLLSGRFPTDEEIESERPVAVVSDSLARAFWPGREPLGRLLFSKSGAATLVVGVVQDVRTVGLEEQQRTAEIYVPIRREMSRADRVLIVRTPANPDAVAARIGAAIVRELPDVAITRAQSVDAALAGTVRARQFQSALFGTFAVTALVLLGIGVLGVVGMHTAARGREIAVRMAIGATAGAVRRMVLRETLIPVGVGLVLGAVAAAWTTNLLSSLIYGIDPHHPQLWAAAAVFVLATALSAAWVPAARASRIDPQAVLRA